MVNNAYCPSNCLFTVKHCIAALWVTSNLWKNDPIALGTMPSDRGRGTVPSCRIKTCLFYYCQPPCFVVV